VASALTSRGAAGIVVEPTLFRGSEAVLGAPIKGSATQIADGLGAFQEAGFTNVEVVLWPPTVAALDAMASVLELLGAKRSSPTPAKSLIPSV
jgi:hypothetical protein